MTLPAIGNRSFTMFDSLKHWIESIRDDSKLFEDADDEVLHSALASLLYHFISHEARHDGREKHKFDELMKQEFELNQAQVNHLYLTAKTTTGDLNADLTTINSHLKDNPAVRMQFMRGLLQLVNIHGAHAEELELFYETLHKVFPDLKAGAEERHFLDLDEQRPLACSGEAGPAEVLLAHSMREEWGDRDD